MKSKTTKNITKNKINELKKLIVSPDTTIFNAMQVLDETAQKIIFVANDDLILKGVVTDGDIRRWILKNGSLSDSISKIMNKNPVKLHLDYELTEAQKIMKSKLIECIPIVDEENKIVDAIWWNDFFDTKIQKYKKINLPLVIMAGGKGTRLDPFTKILPKPLIPIGNKPIIEHIIEKYLEYGCTKIYISINYKANMIKAYFNEINKEYEVYYLEEEKELGTAGALTFLKKYNINKPFFVNNCDIIINADYSDILEFHVQNNNQLTIVGSLKNFKIPYGVIETTKNGEMLNIKEKPEFNYIVNTGMYLLEPEILDLIPENIYFNFTDLIEKCKINNKKIGVYPVSEKSWIDIGQMEELYSALKLFDNN